MTQASTTAQVVAPGAAGQPSHRSRRIALSVLSAVLLVAVAAAGFLVGRATTAPPATPTATPTTAPGLASDSMTALLTARVLAVNSGDVAAIASFYSTDAVMEEFDQTPPVVTTGNVAIAEHLRDYQVLGFRIDQVGTAIELAPFVTEPLLWSGDAGGLVTYQFDSAGKIVHQWVQGALMPTPSAP